MIQTALHRRWWRLALATISLGGTVGWLAPSAGAATPTATQAATLAATPTPSLTWSTLSPATSPPPLRGAAAVYDSDNNTIVVFGGLRSNGTASADTWVWNGSAWTDFPNAGPPARQMASLAFDPGLHQLILFGGVGADGSLLDDTWAWNGASWYQEPASSTGTPPSPRAGATISYDPSGNLVLFGGTGVQATTPPPPPTTTTTTPAPTTTTTTPAPTTTTTTAPSTGTPTNAPAAGVTANGLDVTPPTTATSGPTPTTSTTPTTAPPDTTPASPGVVTAQAVQHPSSAKSVAATNLVNLSDTWLWTSNGWQATAATGPSGRVGAAATYDPNHRQVVLFGGSAVPSVDAGATTSAPLSDTWVWNGTAWAEQKPHQSPPDRAGGALVFDNALNRAVLFGGATASGVLNDTWLWNGSNWAPATTSAPPAARSAAAASYDPIAQQLLVYGGGTATGTALSDTMLLSLAPPIALAPTTPSTSGPAGPSTQPTTTPKTTRAGTTKSTPRPGASTTAPITVSASTPGLGPAQGAPSLAATVETAHRGEPVLLKASGFMPGTLVQITFHSRPFTVGKKLADAKGSVVATVTVPEAAAFGPHHFVAMGMNPLGQMREASTPIQIDASALLIPSSGSKVVTAIMVAIAIALPFITWSVLGLRSRWRRRTAARTSS